MDGSYAIATAHGVGQALAQVAGKPVIASLGQLAPSTFGNTMLELHNDKVIERTRWLVSTRESHVPLTELDSVDITTRGNPILLLLGILTLAFVIGVVFIVLYFFLGKHRFLVIRSRSNAQIVCLTGDERPYRQFAERLLASAAVAKRGQAK